MKVTGYPGVKGDEMWEAAGTIMDDTTYYLFYNNQTAVGQSGGPHWWRHPNFAHAAAGIHAGHDPNTGWNVSTEVRKAVFNTISSWKND